MRENDDGHARVDLASTVTVVVVVSLATRARDTAVRNLTPEVQRLTILF